jgi:hypothetical protein
VALRDKFFTWILDIALWALEPVLGVWWVAKLPTRKHQKHRENPLLLDLIEGNGGATNSTKRSIFIGGLVAMGAFLVLVKATVRTKGIEGM